MSELKPTTTTRKLLYASPRLGIQLFMGIIDFALLFLYKEVYLLDPFLVGIALMIGKLSAGIFQFIIPWISDHITPTKMGRRKPFMLVMTPLLAISFVMLLLPGPVLGATPPELTLFGWFAGFNALAQGMYAVTTIFHSWTAEQFPVYERPRVSQFLNLYNFIGMGVTAVFSFVVLTEVQGELQADPTVIPPEFLNTIIIFAIVMIGFMYFCIFYMPVEKAPKSKSVFKEDFKKVWNDKNYLKMIFIQALCSLGWAMMNGLLLGYVDKVLALTGMNKIIVAGLLIIILIAALSFWRKKVETIGKKNTLILLFKVAIIAAPISLIGLFAFSRSIIVAIIFVFAIAVSQSGWTIFPYIIYADLAENAEKRDGEMYAGLYTGFPALLLNIFQAVSYYLSAWLLALPDINNGGTPFSLGYVLWGPISACFFIVTLIYIKKFIILDFDWEKKQKEQLVNKN